MEKNIITTVGLDPILLHHFIKHYKSIGVDNFYIVVWGDSKEVKYDEIVNVLKTFFPFFRRLLHWSLLLF